MNALPVLSGSLDSGAASESVVALLGRFEAPLEIDRFGASFVGLVQTRADEAVAFRLCFQEVPFRGRAERRNNRPVLTIAGDLGTLPYTIENARRRRRLLKVLSAAQGASGLRWEITPQHDIRVTGEIDLGPALTPEAVIVGTTTLLLRSQPFLDLAVAVAGEE